MFLVTSPVVVRTPVCVWQVRCEWDAALAGGVQHFKPDTFVNAGMRGFMQSAIMLAVVNNRRSAAQRAAAVVIDAPDGVVPRVVQAHPDLAADMAARAAEHAHGNINEGIKVSPPHHA